MVRTSSVDADADADDDDLVLTILNDGAYLTFKSILHNALNLF